MSEQEQWSDDEVVQYLKALKVTIEEGLSNIGENDDDVSGFAMSGFQIPAPSASPQLVARLGPKFGALGPDLASSNGHCGIICGPSPAKGGGFGVL